jgi:DNA-directed RNA polymerase specialized sigma subunit
MANYYNNDEVQSWVVEYLSYPEEERKENDRALFLREKTMVEVGKIVNGIIFKHKFTIWEPYDDLYQEAMEACTKALEKFDPTYVTSKGETATTFNYFSLTAKRCLKFYTMRNKKNRTTMQLRITTIR